MRVLMVAVGGAVVVGAVSIGALAWTSGGSASCDTAALESAMHDGVARGEHLPQGTEVRITMPDGCGDADMAAAMPAVSRTWHVMPGGAMMRQPQHADP